MRRLIRVFLALVIALCVLFGALAEETLPTEDVAEPSSAPTEQLTQQQTKQQQNNETGNTQPDESGNTTPDSPASNPTGPTDDTPGGDPTLETESEGGNETPDGGGDDDADKGEGTGGTGESTGDDSDSPSGTDISDGTDIPDGMDTPGGSDPSGESGSDDGEQGGESSGTAVIGISAEPSEDVLLENGVLTVPEGRSASLVFSWNYDGACDLFEITLLDGRESAVLSISQAETSYSLDAASLPEERHILQVEAVSGDETVARGRYSFEIALEVATQEDGSREGKGPGGNGGAGGRRSGGSSGKSGASGRGLSGRDTGSEAAQGFRVTPGEALASGHASGTKDMQLYDAVELTASDEMICAYSLGGKAPDIVLDDGNSLFTAAIENDQLTLASDADGTWSLSGLSLRVLSRSGIEVLTLQCGDFTAQLDTAQPLDGSCYARLCAEGYVSSDYEYEISAGGVRVKVGGNGYRIDGAELVPIEG